MENPENGNGEAMAFDPNGHFASLDAANEYLQHHGMAESFAAISADHGDWILYPLSQKAAPESQPDASQGESQPDASKAPSKPRKAARKASKDRGKARRAAIEAKAEAEAKALAEAKAAAEAEAAKNNAPKDMHYSGLPQNFPSDADIIAGNLKGMALRDRESYQAALKGEMPFLPDFSAETHRPFRKALAEIQAYGAAGDLAALENWKGGKGYRMTCSSSIPLGRYHQKLILALRFQNADRLKAEAEAAEKKAARTAKREAKKAQMQNAEANQEN